MTRPASANATASHCVPRTRSCNTGHAISMVQNGMVNTSTDVRPAPPPASAIVVAVKLIVVWKNPVTTTAIHERGQNGRPSHSIAANRNAMATRMRSMLYTAGCA